MEDGRTNHENQSPAITSFLSVARWHHSHGENGSVLPTPFLASIQIYEPLLKNHYESMKYLAMFGIAIATNYYSSMGFHSYILMIFHVSHHIAILLVVPHTTSVCLHPSLFLRFVSDLASAGPGKERRSHGGGLWQELQNRNYKTRSDNY